MGFDPCLKNSSKSVKVGEDICEKTTKVICNASCGEEDTALSGFFPKLQLNKIVKFVKLAKPFNHWPKLWKGVEPRP